MMLKTICRKRKLPLNYEGSCLGYLGPLVDHADTNAAGERGRLHNPAAPPPSPLPHLQHDKVLSSTRDPDPGSGAFLALDPGSGRGKKSRSGSGMKKPDHISECLETLLFELKYIDSSRRIRHAWNKVGSGMEKCGSGIRDIHPGSATLVLSAASRASPFTKLNLLSLDIVGTGL